MADADLLNEAVTRAIEQARAASRVAAEAWDAVAHAEGALANAEGLHPNERAVGRRGVMFAARTAARIRTAEIL